MNGTEWPVSVWQRFCLLLERGRPGFAISPWFTLNAVVHVTGPLEPAALSDAFAELVRTHDLLRTRLDERGPEPVQVVTPRANAEVESVDEQDIMNGDGLIHVPVALDSASPIRLRMATRSPKEHLLALHLHHLMADPATLWNSVRELACRYSARLGGPPVAPPSAQYGEFTIEQAHLERSGRPAAERWWRTAMRDVRQRTVPPRPETGSHYHRDEVLSAAELAEVAAWSRRGRSTLFTTFLAALSCAAAPHYDSAGPLLFTSMFARRDAPRWRGMLGATTLPVYLPLPQPPARLSGEYVTRVRDAVLGCHKHARFPLEEIEALGGIPGHASRGADYTVPFFEYLPIEWPTGLRFGPATGVVVAATGPRDGAEERSLTVRVRTDDSGALSGRASCDGRNWVQSRTREVCRGLREQVKSLVAAP